MSKADSGRKKRWLLLVGLLIFIFCIQLFLSWVAGRDSYRVETNQPAVTPPPFPVGVNPQTKTIAEQPELATYLEQYVASNHTTPLRTHSWAMLLRARLEQFAWYQQLATPTRRTLVIWSGNRHEQVAQHFQSLLGWNAEETARFTSLVKTSVPGMNEGMFYPGRYIFDLPITPEIAAFTINQRFLTEVHLRYTAEVSERIPLENALTIASLIEREAFDFEDMRLISGVIWNRLFIDMPLQLDATLQYARGSIGNNRSWWPIPRPADKFIDSPYNTYQVDGLPPGPIANPSVDAIIAALNPRTTDCLFYFHTDDGSFYCTENYEEHVELLKTHFGQGR